MVQDLHHEGVGLVLNLKMIFGVVLHSFMRLEGRKTESCAMP